MTTGAPIYLVSACSSGEEFVAAFRRYADRNGVVFVPIAEPLPAGKKARFALTLVDGGVMLEGDGEVVSSARTPSVLYGRIGMTVKFLAPDEPSRTLLAELEKARLALKPQAPSIAPRPASVPAAPRPRPPVPSGRIDAVNALAECVAIGELGPSPAATAASRAASPRFTVPAIPAAPGGPAAPHRPPTAQMPTLPASRPQAPSRTPTPATGAATSLGMPPLARRPSSEPPASPRTPTPAEGTPRAKPPAAGTATSLGMVALPKITPTEIVAATPPRVAPLAPELDNDEPTDLTTIPLESTPETTIRTAPPRPSSQASPHREPRRTALGLAVVSSAPPTTPAARIETEDDAPATEQMPALVPDEHVEPDTPRVTAPLAKVAVEEPTPSGDWTMVPGANGPTILPTPRPEKKVPPGPPTGDFIIALDPTRPDGWSEPAKLDKRADSPRPGPPVSAVASERALDSDANAGRELAPETGPKVQIDPTLIEPLQPMPVELDAPPAALAGAFTPAPEQPPFPAAAGAARAHPIDPSRRAYDAVRLPTSPIGDATSVVTIGRRRRTVVIAASAGAVLVLGIGLVLALGGDNDARGHTTPSASGGSEPAPAIGVGSAAPATPTEAPAPTEDPAPTEEPAPTEPVEPEAIEQVAVARVETPTSCEVAVRSSPAGAEIVLDKDTVVGTTPTTLTLPCGVEARLTFKKARYVATTRTITPSAESPRPLKVGLAKITFSVKVSSSPAGATITLGGRTIGVTPTTVKLPAFEASTLKISKAGYAVDLRKVTPKANNLAVHAKLKKAGRSR